MAEPRPDDKTQTGGSRIMFGYGEADTFSPSKGRFA